MVEEKQFVDKRERKKREKERKGEKKEVKKEEREKKGRKKEGGVGIHSNKVGSFPTRDTLGLGAIQWPWSLVPTWGLVQKQFKAKCVRFLGTFDTRN